MARPALELKRWKFKPFNFDINFELDTENFASFF